MPQQEKKTNWYTQTTGSDFNFIASTRNEWSILITIYCSRRMFDAAIGTHTTHINVQVINGSHKLPIAFRVDASVVVLNLYFSTRRTKSNLQFHCKIHTCKPIVFAIKQIDRPWVVWSRTIRQRQCSMRLNRLVGFPTIDCLHSQCGGHCLAAEKR